MDGDILYPTVAATTHQKTNPVLQRGSQAAAVVMWSLIISHLRRTRNHSW